MPAVRLQTFAHIDIAEIELHSIVEDPMERSSIPSTSIGVRISCSDKVNHYDWKHISADHCRKISVLKPELILKVYHNTKLDRLI